MALGLATTMAESTSSDDEQTFSSVILCNLAGITYRQLDFWCRSRLGPLQPGSGYARRFTSDETALVVLAAHLLRAGLTVDAAFTVARTAYGAGVAWIARGDGVSVLVDVSRVLAAAGL